MRSVAIILLCALAGAQTPTLEEGAPGLAQTRYLTGRQLYLEGKLEEAAHEFRGALDLFPKSAKLAFNLGRTLERLGRLEDAANYYEQYMQLDPQGDDLAALVKSLRERVSAKQPELVLSSRPVGARVLLDAAREPLEHPTPSTIRVEPGPHVVRFQLDGYEEAVREIVAPEGERVLVSAELVPRAVEAAGAGPDWVGWSLVGAGVVGVGVGGALFALAKGKSDESADLGPRDPEKRDALREDFDAFVLGGWIAAGAGVALAATGTTLLLLPDGQGAAVAGTF